MFKKRKATSQPPAAKTLGLDNAEAEAGVRVSRHLTRQPVAGEEEEEEDAVIIDRNKARSKARSQFSSNKTSELFENSTPVATSIPSTDEDVSQSMYSTEAIARMKQQTRFVVNDDAVTGIDNKKTAQEDQLSGKPMILSGEEAKRFLHEQPEEEQDTVQSEDEAIGPTKPSNNQNSKAISSSNRASPTPEVIPSDSEADEEESDMSDDRTNAQTDPGQILAEFKVLKEKLRSREEEMRTKSLAKNEMSMNTINIEEKRAELVQAVKKLSEVESVLRYCKALHACQRLKVVQMTKADDPKLVWQEVNDEFVHPHLIIDKFLSIANNDSERFSKRVAPVLGNVLVPHVLTRLWTERVEFDGLDVFLRQDEEIRNALSNIASDEDRDHVIHSLLVGVRERYSEFSILAQSDY